MIGIWWFAPFVPDEPDLQRLDRHCRFTLGDELLGAGPGAYRFSPGNPPTARLEIALESFSLDLFCWVDSRSRHPYLFVSQTLRDAMALVPQDVQYLPVDSSLSAPLPRSQNYMAMHVQEIETVADREESFYVNQGMPDEKGIVDDSKEPISPGRIAIRHDAAPKGDIFRDSFFSKFVFCTDKLAVRVLQSQCSGIRIVDPASLFDPLRFRSLRGIEEESWDEAQEGSHTVSEGRGGTELHRAAGNNPHGLANALCADYGDHIPGVQFAAVPMLMGSLRKARADVTNWEHPVRLSDGSLRLGTGEIVTASRLLGVVDRSSERDAVWSAITKFELNPEQAADVLAARAYVWANRFAPESFADVPASGAALESVSHSIMLIELASPGTLYLALQGDRLSTEYIRGAAEEALSDAAIVES